MLEPGKKLCCFQQDKAKQHVAITTLTMRDFFGKGITARNVWPPRSPDPTQVDLYLEAFKESVKKTENMLLKKVLEKLKT